MLPSIALYPFPRTTLSKMQLLNISIPFSSRYRSSSGKYKNFYPQMISCHQGQKVGHVEGGSFNTFFQNGHFGGRDVLKEGVLVQLPKIPILFLCRSWREGTFEM